MNRRFEIHVVVTYPDEELVGTGSLCSSFSVSVLEWFGHDDDLEVGGEVFNFGGGFGGILIKVAGGSGIGVSFNFTTTLSTLPSRFPFEMDVSLLKRLLNLNLGMK